MSNSASGEAAKAVVRRNTEEVQGKGDFDVFEVVFADDFIDHTPQPNRRARPRQGPSGGLPRLPRRHPLADRRRRDRDDLQDLSWDAPGNIPGSGADRPESPLRSCGNAMRVHNGKITEHWGVANLFSLMQQLGALPAGDTSLTSS